MIRAFILYFSVLFSGAYSQSWQQLQDFPGVERDDAAVFRIGSNVYVGTGLITGWTPTIDFYRFDLNTETWSVSQSLPSGEQRQYASGFMIDDSGYIFGGVNSSSSLRDLWRFDPSVAQWSEKSSLPASSRGGSCGFVIGDKYYLVGGKDSVNKILDEVWLYEPGTNTWTQKTTMPFGGLWRASSTAFGNKGYLIFGEDSAGNYSKDLYQYDPWSDQWNLLSVFPGEGRAYSSMIAMDSTLVVTMGTDTSGTEYNDVWLYDLRNASWTEKTLLPARPRKGGVVFQHLWNLYYTTGINDLDARLKETWKLNEVTSVKGNSETQLHVYPNPAGNSLHIKNAAEASFSIRDNLGRVLMSGSLQGSEILDISALENGIYFLQVKERTVRFIKNR